MMRLSIGLRGVCAVEARLNFASDALEAVMSRFGPVKRHRHESFKDVIEWLMPLASFANRYVLLPWLEWTIILHNQPDLAAVAQLIPVSKATTRRAVHASWAEEGRFWRVASGGHEVRGLACYNDGGRWVWHQQGEALPFEKLELYSKKRKKDRLPPDIVQEYLGSLVGANSPPDWRRLLSGKSISIERSTHELQVPVEYFEAEIDI